MIRMSEILMGRDKEFPLNKTLQINAALLLIAINVVRKAYNKPMIVTSGYRPGYYNKDAGGAKLSAHTTCEAIDISDPDGSLAKWCLSNMSVLVKAGMYMENPNNTKGWVHLQIRKTKSGNRIFNP